MPTFAQLLKDTVNKQNQLNTLKALGCFICQACVVPVRMSNFFKEMIDNDIVGDLVAILASVASQVTALHLTAV